MAKDTKVLTNKKTDSRSGVLKRLSIGSVVILIGIVFFFNILFDKLFGKTLEFDFSADTQNTLSQVSVDYLNSLPEGTKIRIVGLFSKPDNTFNTLYQYVVPLLDEYVDKSNGKVSLEYIDPTVDPTIISALDPQNVNSLEEHSGDFVVYYNGMSRVIGVQECYLYYYYANESSPRFTGQITEYTFTNAMNALTCGIRPKAYYVTGLQEDGNTYMKQILDNMAFDSVELPSSDSFAIPDDCDLLILNGPNTDISESMYVSMTDYLNKGGKIYIAVDYMAGNGTEDFVLLNQLVNQMNLNIDNKCIYENDIGLQLSGSQVNSMVHVTDNYKNSDNHILQCTYARPVRVIDNPYSQVATDPVLQTSDKASVVDMASEDIREEDSGLYSVGMHSVRTDNGAEVYVFGTTNLSSDWYISNCGISDQNVVFFRKIVKSMVGDKGVNDLNIESKQIEDYRLNITKSSQSVSMVMLIVFMLLIPAVLLLASVFVYTRRKNL